MGSAFTAFLKAFGCLSLVVFAFCGTIFGVLATTFGNWAASLVFSVLVGCCIVALIALTEHEFGRSND